MHHFAWATTDTLLELVRAWPEWLKLTVLGSVYVTGIILAVYAHIKVTRFFETDHPRRRR